MQYLSSKSSSRLDPQFGIEFLGFLGLPCRDSLSTEFRFFVFCFSGTAFFMLAKLSKRGVVPSESDMSVQGAHATVICKFKRDVSQ